MFSLLASNHLIDVKKNVRPSVILLTGSGLEDGAVHCKQNTKGEWSEKRLKTLAENYDFFQISNSNNLLKRSQ